MRFFAVIGIVAVTLAAVYLFEQNKPSKKPNYNPFSLNEPYLDSTSTLHTGDSLIKIISYE